MRQILCVAVALFCACAYQIGLGHAAQVSTQLVFAFPVVDEAASDPALDQSMRLLRAAVRARDLNSLLKLTSPDLRKDFASEAFFGRPSNSYWQELDRAINLGGAFTTTRGTKAGSREYCAPYVYSKYPYPAPDELLSPDGETAPWAIVADRAAVRSRPDPRAQVLAYLGRQLVAVNGDALGTPPQWYGVVLNKRDAWVAAKDIRDPDDFHVCLVRAGNVWLLAEFARDTFRFP